MPHHVEPLSAAQIHSVYSSNVESRNKASEVKVARYSKTSFSGRDPDHPGHPPPIPQSTSKKKKD